MEKNAKGLIVKLGERPIWQVNQSKTLTLPPLWLVNSGLNKGDKVRLEMNIQDKSLVIRPAKG